MKSTDVASDQDDQVTLLLIATMRPGLSIPTFLSIATTLRLELTDLNKPC